MNTNVTNHDKFEVQECIHMGFEDPIGPRTTTRQAIHSFASLEEALACLATYPEGGEFHYMQIGYPTWYREAVNENRTKYQPQDDGVPF